MNNILTAAEAYMHAIRYAGLENNDPVLFSAARNGGLYELVVRSNLQRYEFYVGAVSGDVLGISCEPVLDMAEALCYHFEKSRYCA